MYRLLIVDDEEFEREGMAQLIDWEQYGIEVVGTAWNGLDGIEKTRQLQPDIILTDIKMPVMDGIELIRRVRKSWPQIEFAVLSGYGEYEYTSKAMEQGVRHYILKPCDEERIAEAIEKVKKDVESRREQKRRDAYFDQIAPQARKQLFRNLLLNREQGREENLFVLPPGEALPESVRLLVFRSRDSFDGLEELLEGLNLQAYVATVVRNDAVVMISDARPEILIRMVRRIEREFLRVRREPVRAALSNSGSAEQLSELYEQAEELFLMGVEIESEPLLHYGMMEGKKQDMEVLVDFTVAGQTRDYAELLQSLQVTFLRMRKRKMSLEEKRREWTGCCAVYTGRDCRREGNAWRTEAAVPDGGCGQTDMAAFRAEKNGKRRKQLGFRWPWEKGRRR